MFQKLLFILLVQMPCMAQAGTLPKMPARNACFAIADTVNPPSCTAAPNTTVWCDLFDPSLASYPGIIDQSSNADSVAILVDYSQFDTTCRRGVIIRRFTVFNIEGDTGACSQQIQVDYRQNYYIRFPDDVIATTCQPSGQYGQPVFLGNDCELVSATYEDAMITVVPDACFRIDRRWSVISWCTYNPAQGLVQVPNPNPSPIANHPSNLPGPVVSPIDTLGHPWSASQVLVSPGNSFPTNYAIFYNPAANGYEYTQRIKIIDTTDPSVLSASETNTLDVSANDSILWNALYWWNDVNQTHDLCEGPTDISITVTDDCSGGNLQISFLLSLDLDGDGIMETGINSDALGANGIGWNNVPFGNLVMGNGTPRTFDNRPVLPEMKYGFALEQVMNGQEKTARVRFNTLEQPNQYINAELPHGVHKIRWFISDGCGNEVASEHLLVVRDGKAPTVVCLQPLSVNIMPTNLITLWATDFLQYAEDNCTPTDWLRYGLRKAGAGTGFPVDQNGNPITNVTFTCNELGANVVELWCIDQAGNSDFCEAFVMVQDNNQNCGTAPMQISGNISTETNSPIEGVPLRFYSGSTFAPPFSYNVVTDNNGNYTVPVNLPVVSNGYLQPQSDDQPLNGVTTFDLVLLSKHILGLEPLGSPYKIIAGDANNSKTLTTFDIVELRKLILGIYNDLPANYSWRFVLKSYVFPNPLNPFQPPFPDTVRFMAFNQNPHAGDFIGVKIGDLNNSAVTNNLAAPDERFAGTKAFLVETKQPTDDLNAGETISLQFSATAPMAGCQFTLELGKLEVLEIEPGPNMVRDQFASFPDKNALTVAWETGGRADFTLHCRATEAGNLRDMLSVSDRITRAEAYDEEGTQRFEVTLKYPVLEQLALYQNRPNPFEDETLIPFNLPEAGEVTLEVFDGAGQLINRQSGYFESGMQQFVLKNLEAHPVGLWFYQVSTAREQVVRKMVKR